jgi:hypothetical protein
MDQNRREKMNKFKGYDADYDSEAVPEVESNSSYDTDREFPIEKRCCITGNAVKHSFCRYPDADRGTMMVLSREVMLAYSGRGMSLSVEFERVLESRRKKEAKKK